MLPDNLKDIQDKTNTPKHIKMGEIPKTVDNYPKKMSDSPMDTKWYFDLMCLLNSEKDAQGRLLFLRSERVVLWLGATLEFYWSNLNKSHGKSIEAQNRCTNRNRLLPFIITQ